MHARQKVFRIVLVLALALAALGWVTVGQVAHAPAIVQQPTTAAQMSVISGANAGLAVVLPAITPPGVHTNVSWNG